MATIYGTEKKGGNLNEHNLWQFSPASGYKYKEMFCELYSTSSLHY